jgi:ABC-type phosphate/phosphonate transport system ATPase subunit
MVFLHRVYFPTKYRAFLGLEASILLLLQPNSYKMSVFEFHTEKFMELWVLVVRYKFIFLIRVLGCGKTTLLNILSHRIEGRIGGDILLNGQPLNSKLLRMNVSSCDMRYDVTTSVTTANVMTYIMSQRLAPQNACHDG